MTPRATGTQPAAGTELAKSGEALKAGPIGLAVILLLAIACYFLFKSMSKHMREVRENFPAELPTHGRTAPAAGLTRAETVRPDTVGSADPATRAGPDLDVLPGSSGTVSGDAVVGDAVSGDAVVGDAVVGDAVVGDEPGPGDEVAD